MIINELKQLLERNSNLNQLSEDEDKDEDTIEMLLDIISDDPNSSKYDKYKDELLNKYGIDWKLKINDDSYIQSANLDDIKNKKDFRDYNHYITYARKIWKLRKIPQLKSIDKTINIDIVKSKLKNLNIDVVEISENSKNLAQAIGNRIEIPNPCSIDFLIHEIGHVFDNTIYKGKIAKIATNAISFYDIGTACEVIAENFCYYFLSKDLLKNKLPLVYNDLNNSIPSEWKSTILDLINN